MNERNFEMTEVAEDAFERYVSLPVNYEIDDSEIIERDSFIAGWDASVQNIYNRISDDDSIPVDVKAMLVQILAENRAETEI